MTRRELINILSEGDMDEDICVYVTDGKYFSNYYHINDVEDGAITLTSKIPEVD